MISTSLLFTHSCYFRNEDLAGFKGAQNDTPNRSKFDLGAYKAPEASRGAPRGIQEAKALQEASREPFWRRLDSILHPSGLHLGPFVHSFWPPGGSAE